MAATSPETFIRHAALALLLSAAAASSARALWIPQGTPISPSGDVATPVGVVADAAGGSYLAWQRNSTLATGELVRLDASGNVVAGWAAGQHSLTGQLLGIGSDAAGGVLAGWFDGNETRSQRYQPSGAIKTGWPAAGVSMRTTYSLFPGGTESSPRWVATAVGECWSAIRFDDGFGSSVWVASVLPSGAVRSSLPYCPPVIGGEQFPGEGDWFGMWAQTDGVLTYGRGIGELVTPEAAMSSWHQGACWSFYKNQPRYAIERLTSDGVDGVLGLVAPLESGAQRRIQHWTGTGALAPGWTADGSPFATPEPAFDPSSPPVSAADGNGGLFVGWTQPGSLGTQVRVAHRLADGLADPAWPVDGVLVCEATGGRQGLKLESDGAGGVILAWVDHRADVNGDLFAAHLAGDGAIDADFATNGQPVCTVPGAQSAPRLTAIGDGSFVVLWKDERSGAPAVFAQRLPVPSFVGVPQGRTEPGLRLSLHPNPSRGPFRVAFTLSESHDVRIEIVDLLGRRIHEEVHSGMSAGLHEIELHGPPFKPGLWWVCVTAGLEVRAARAVMMPRL